MAITEGIALRVRAGATVSTVKLTALLAPVWPTESDCVTRTVCVPSGRLF